MYPKIAEYLRDRTVLLVGFGREGQSSYRYIRKYFPEKPIAVADKNAVSVDDPFVTCICGENYLDCIGDFDVVLKSPGISFKNVDAPTHTEITCQVDLFLRFADCRKVGVTGSKGKTTTSTLTYQMLKAAGKDCRLIGNIGVPVFDSLADLTPDTVAVIEMSSHQLEFTHASPEVAVLTNLYEEHLEHYKGGFAGYTAANHILRCTSARRMYLSITPRRGFRIFRSRNKYSLKKLGFRKTTLCRFRWKTSIWRAYTIGRTCCLPAPPPHISAQPTATAKRQSAIFRVLNTVWKRSVRSRGFPFIMIASQPFRTPCCARLRQSVLLAR